MNLVSKGKMPDASVVYEEIGDAESFFNYTKNVVYGLNTTTATTTPENLTLREI